MTGRSWSDINKDGIRLENIIRRLNAMLMQKEKETKKYILNDVDKILGLSHGIVSLTREKRYIAEDILGLKEIVERARQREREILNTR